MWQQYGTGNHEKMLALYDIATTLGPAKVQVIVKAHILAGEDAISKLGSKRAAVALNPDEFLRNCGEQPTFKED